MKSSHAKRLEEALEIIAQDDALEFPDARLEERLKRSHGNVGSLGNRFGGARPPLSRVAGLLLFFALSGLAVGSTLGFERLKAWWYSIQIDGEEVSGVAEDGEPQVIHYVSEDGYRVSVRVERTQLGERGVRTQFDALEQSAGQVLLTSEVTEETLDEDAQGQASTPRRDADGAQLRAGRRFDPSVLEEASVLHTWTTTSGERRSLWLGPDLDGDGSWLLLERPDTELEGPVELVLSTARPIAAGGQVSIQQLENGALLVELADGHGWEIALSIAAPGHQNTVPGAAEFTTPSGRVRVQTGD